MKKLMLSLALGIVLMAFNTTYAAVSSPGEKVKQAFSREFAKIKDVQWEKANIDGVYKASFVFNSENLAAYFSEEGEFLGTIRTIGNVQLPILVSKALDMNYPEATISSVSELSKPDGLSYYITLITSKGTRVIRSTANGELTVHQRSKH
jgi:hypothetical protein